MIIMAFFTLLADTDRAWSIYQTGLV